jgi:hypothetical protein
MQLTPQSISRAINASADKFSHFRQARGRFMAAMVGRFYGKSGGITPEDRKAAPLNLMHSAVSTLVPNLVFNNPRTKVRTNILMYRDYTDTLELATNHLIQKARLRDELRKAVMDSIFMAGFMNTGLADSGQYIQIEGMDYQVGQPFAERVDPDDMILDSMARDWDEQAFIGKRIRVPLEELQASGLYDPDALEQSWQMTSRYDGAGQEIGEAERLSGGKVSEDEFRKYIDLAEVYIPSEQRIVTLPYVKGAIHDKFIRTAEYNGPETGPYHMLGYAYVPDNLLPVAPAAVWYDLHVLGNRIARKLSRQSERLKRVLAYEPMATEDVNQIADADDGETVPVQNINAIKEVQYGGTGKEAYEWMEWVKRNFSEQAGNIDMLSGQGTNAPTATQAEMLQANTSVRLSDMQGQVYNFTAGIVRDLAFYLHTDPLIELPLVRRKDGVETQVVYTPEMRRGEWMDYNLDVEPFSMGRPDPNMAVRRRMEFATNVIPAAAQAMMLMGPGFNIGAFLKRMALDVGIEDADEWLSTPEVQAWVVQRMQQTLATGNPGKAAGAAQPGLPLPGTAQPNQPVPTMMGPTGGISPSTETAMAQQETSGELQAGREPSARSLAMSMG